MNKDLNESTSEDCIQHLEALPNSSLLAGKVTNLHEALPNSSGVHKDLLSSIEDVPTSIKKKLVLLLQQVAGIHMSLDWSNVQSLVQAAETFVENINNRARKSETLEMSHVDSAAREMSKDAMAVQQTFTQAKISMDALVSKNFGFRQQNELRRKAVRHTMAMNRLVSSIGNSIVSIGLVAIVVVSPGTLPIALPLCVLSTIESVRSCTIDEIDNAQVHAERIIAAVCRKIAILSEAYRQVKIFSRQLQDQLVICETTEDLIPAAHCIKDMLADLNESLEKMK